MSAEDFKCTVCVSWLDDPRSLPCGHTYCINCVLVLSIDTKDRRLKPACPLCRKAFEPPNGDVQAMPVNQSLRDGALRWMEAARSGQTLQPPESEEHSDECLIHVGSPLEFYCPSCPDNPFKCFECASEHTQSAPLHELISADEGKEKLIQEIQHLSVMVHEKRDKATKSLKEIQEKMDKVDVQCEEIEKEIDSKFDRYLSQIEKLEISSRKKLRDLYQESLQPLEEDEQFCETLKSEIQQLLQKHEASTGDERAEIEQRLKELTSTKLDNIPQYRHVRISIPEVLKLDLDQEQDSPEQPSLDQQAAEWVSFADELRATPVIASLGPSTTLESGLQIPEGSACTFIRVFPVPGEQSLVVVQGSPNIISRVDIACEGGKAKSLSTQPITPHGSASAARTALGTSPHRLTLATLTSGEDSQITAAAFPPQQTESALPQATTDAAIPASCVDIAVDWAGAVYSAHSTLPGTLCKYAGEQAASRLGLRLQWAVSDSDPTRVWCGMLCDGGRLLVLARQAAPPHALTLLVYSLRGALVHSLALSLGLQEAAHAADSGPGGLALFRTGSRGFGIVHPSADSVFFFAADGTLCGSVAKSGVVAAAFVADCLVLVRQENGSLVLDSY